jgi:hypothetical protein
MILRARGASVSRTALDAAIGLEADSLRYLDTLPASVPRTPPRFFGRPPLALHDVQRRNRLPVGSLQKLGDRETFDKYRAVMADLCDTEIAKKGASYAISPDRSANKLPSETALRDLFTAFRHL